MQRIIAFFLSLLAGGFGATATAKRPRAFRYEPDVERWRSLALDVLEAEGVRDELEVAIVLAIVHIESNGDPRARRTGSQFYGLTQVGKAVARETRTSRPTMLIVDDAHTGAREALVAFARWCKMYASFHRWDAERIAVGWKGGVGTLAQYNRRVAHGEDEAVTMRWLDVERWRTGLYLRYMRVAYALWSAPNLVEMPRVAVR